MSRRRPESEPSPLRGLLGSAAAGYGLDDALSAGTLWKRWTEVVGPDVAAHAEPTSLRGGVLRIRADSPVWAHEIGYLAEEIKKRANESLGRDAVSEVKVWNAPGSPSRGHSEAAPATAGKTADEGVMDLDQDPLEALEKARSAWVTKRRGRAH